MEHKRVTECYYCGGDIVDGESYYDFFGLAICDGCINEFEKEHLRQAEAVEPGEDI